MKMTFKTEGAVINYNGVPVEIKPITMELEMSVQEIAQGGTNTLKMVDSIKEVIKEAQASAQVYQPSCTSTPATITAKTTAENKTPKAEQHWDLPAVWEVMMKTLPDGFKKSGIGCYAFETGTTKDKNKIKVQIEFNEDSIDMDIYTGSTAIHGYLYSEAKRSRITGINPALMDDMFEEMPDEIKEFVKNYFDRITK